MLPDVLQCIGQYPITRYYPAPNLNSAEVEELSVDS